MALVAVLVLVAAGGCAEDVGFGPTELPERLGPSAPVVHDRWSPATRRPDGRRSSRAVTRRTR